MSLKLILGIISAIVGLYGFIPYLKDIFAKKTTPHAYSWLIWSILQTTGTIAILIGGGGYGALGLALGSLMCIVIFFLSLFFGTKNITLFDTICLIGALVAIGVWILLKNPLWSVILITLIDFAGFLPTYRKGWQEPESETALLYFLSCASNIFALFALSEYTLLTSLYVSSLVVSNGIFVILVYISRKKKTAI